jgi:hypothetical protein
VAKAYNDEAVAAAVVTSHTGEFHIHTRGSATVVLATPVPDAGVALIVLANPRG